MATAKGSRRSARIQDQDHQAASKPAPQIRTRRILVANEACPWDMMANPPEGSFRTPEIAEQFQKFFNCAAALRRAVEEIQSQGGEVPEHAVESLTTPLFPPDHPLVLSWERNRREAVESGDEELPATGPAGTRKRNRGDGAEPPAAGTAKTRKRSKADGAGVVEKGAELAKGVKEAKGREAAKGEQIAEKGNEVEKRGLPS